MRFTILIIAALVPALTFAQEFKILSWNVESGGSDPHVIRRELEEMPEKFDILALSEVDNGLYSDATIAGELGGAVADSLVLRGRTGGNDRLVISFNRKKFDLVEYEELKEFEGVLLSEGGERAPQILTLLHIESSKHFILINNHLARGNADKRTHQAAALVERVRGLKTPVIAVGDFNRDDDFHTEKGNEAFSIFQRDGIFKWIKPAELIDTNWADHNKDGKDDFPDSMLDFVFTAGPAKDWDVSTKVIVRDGDFPDNEKTSDHRPILTTVIVK